MKQWPESWKSTVWREKTGYWLLIYLKSTVIYIRNSDKKATQIVWVFLRLIWLKEIPHVNSVCTWNIPWAIPQSSQIKKLHVKNFISSKCDLVPMYLSSTREKTPFSTRSRADNGISNVSNFFKQFFFLFNVVYRIAKGVLQM